MKSTFFSGSLMIWNTQNPPITSRTAWNRAAIISEPPPIFCQNVGFASTTGMRFPSLSYKSMVVVVAFLGIGGWIIPGFPPGR